jgi:DNA-binding response OmpR family regulator
LNILIADDDDISRLLLRSALTKLGHSVIEAGNGREAWDTWYGGGFPLVISDWMMPGLDGLDICRRIRAEPRAVYTYIVLLTSREGKVDQLEGMKAGADDFITKPFEKDALTARVRVAERILMLHANLRAANADLERRVDERTTELATALRAKEQFLSRASHELRTPMNHVLGFAQLLERDPLTSSQAVGVKHILTSGHHLLRLIDQILEVAESSSMDSGFLGARKIGKEVVASGLSPEIREDERRSLPVGILSNTDAVSTLLPLEPVIRSFIPKSGDAASSRDRFIRGR